VGLSDLLQDINVARAITTAVAPAILVSAAGLLLLGLQTKFHNITDRIRHLDREIIELESLSEISVLQKKRVDTAEAQVDLLLKRCRLARDAIFLLYVSIFLLIWSALSTAVGIMLGRAPGWITFSLFVAGVFSFFLASGQGLREVVISFRVIEEEVAAAREVSPLRETPKGGQS
jgi:hypothetical protein